MLLNSQTSVDQSSVKTSEQKLEQRIAANHNNRTIRGKSKEFNDCYKLHGTKLKVTRMLLIKQSRYAYTDS